MIDAVTGNSTLKIRISRLAANVSVLMKVEKITMQIILTCKLVENWF